MKSKTILLLAALLVGFVAPLHAEKEIKDPYFEGIEVIPARTPKKLQLKEGDRLAICGDSITEQKMYSRIIETYLTVCEPQLKITARQYGWGGEKADGFLRRMTNDVLRFKPTVATTCYGMNDHGYRRYEPEIGETYRTNSQQILRAFKAYGVRPIQGSPGCIGVRPFWSKDDQAKAKDMNINLCTLRNIALEVARKEDAGFADVFSPMYLAAYEGKQNYGPNYELAGKDGVHPGWAGHTVMAYAFLKSMGLKGDIGTIIVDLKSGEANASKGHEVLSFTGDAVKIKSSRYPFCATNTISSDASVRSGMTLVPFNEELNRLMLIVKRGKAEKYKVTWGSESKIYSAKELGRGVNLAADFKVNPFWDAFSKVDEAVAAKQAYETKQIKQLFRSPEAQANMESVVAKTEQERAPLAAAIQTAFVPVEHTIQITAE